MKTLVEETIAVPVSPNSRVFDLWSQVYDVQSNPLLILEERCAMPLLPVLEGTAVLDVGCGTGRWLTKLETLKPASLTGLDCSESMLEHAKKKVDPTTKLEHGECSILPGNDASKSLVLASFVLSYVDELERFAQECARVLQEGGHVLISDMHPVTAAEQDWRRSFHLGGGKIEIAVCSRSLSEIISAFEHHSFAVQALIEPSFGAPERSVFKSAGKLTAFEGLSGIPAIGPLKLQKRQSHRQVIASRQSNILQLTNARSALNSTTWNEEGVRIEDERIVSLGKSFDTTVATLDLNGYVLLPGLVNAHDHLEFALFPKLGRDPDAMPYRNSTEWAQEIHQTHASIIERYRRIPKATQLWWGAMRNLLSGATTVCHHNPLHEEFILPDFPVRVVSHFGWAHSLAFDPHLAERFQATSQDLPFILHAAEGIDEGSREEISRLERMNVLSERTVLVHGLACAAEEVSLINKRCVSVVICPTSNDFLFARTPSWDLLTSIERLALGSDSPITATGDLLDEIHYLHEIGLDPDLIYRMVTSNPANMLQLEEGQGRIIESGVADLIAVRNLSTTPAHTLAELTFVDVELVLRAGQVKMASPTLYARLPDDLRVGMELIEVEGHQRWIRSSLQVHFETAKNILGQDTLFLAGKEVRYVSTL